MVSWNKSTAVPKVLVEVDEQELVAPVGEVHVGMCAVLRRSVV